jgi:nitrous oxidase accessory protein NosD
MIRRLAITATAAALLALGASAPLAAVLTVDDDARDCPNAAYRTIGGALAAAQPGNQISVCAGTYTEQLVLTKTVRLVGTGHPVIRPTALPESRPSVIGGRPITGGIIVDAPSAVITGIQLDMSANGLGNCTTILTGIYFREASGVVIDSTVTGVRVAGQAACDSGVGVYIESSGLSKAKVTLQNDQITNCQKGGVVANGARTTVKVRRGAIVGSGPSPAVENGIQIAQGARGRVGQVAIHGQRTTATGKTATGILAYQAGSAAVRGTAISDGQSGIFVVGRALIVGNSLSSLTDGIVLLGDQSKLLSNDLDGASTSGVFVNGNRNNIRFGSLAHMPIGLWFYGGQGNSFKSVTFDPSVPVAGQGVSGGTRNLTETAVTPLLPLCRSDGDCNDGTNCTTGTCNTATGLCDYTAACNDGNPCTDDLCGSNGCLHLSNTASCNDGNSCTVNDACLNGACNGGLPATCEDADSCTLDACGPTLGCVHLSACDDRNPCTADSCDAVNGCRNVVVSNGTPCPDANLCNGTEVCQGGICMGGTPANCNDNNPCTIDTCNLATGCQHLAVTNNTPCSDGNLCNGLELCQAGTCRPGTALPCNDGNACTTDTCNTVGGCVHTPVAGCQPCSVTADCNDNNACTNDVCNAGACQNTAVTNGTSCADSTVCNGAEVCQAGVCTSGTALNCDDNSLCTVDSCDPVAGCRHVGVADGTSCADGTVCNGAEVCQGGICQPGSPLNCDDGNPCSTDVCLAVTGCQHTPLANNTPCPDLTLCNGAEFCQSGICIAGTPLNCNDANLCTLDTCDPALGCRHTPLANGTPCLDGNVCNGVEACQGGVCQPNTPLNCNDGNACTVDSCNGVSGCINVPIPGCRPCGVAADCNDNQPCTLDTCVSGVCQNTNVADGTTCLDGNVCNGTEICFSGICNPGTAPNCNDANACTNDTCDPIIGCQHTPVPNGTSCADATVCNGNETCQAGVCAPGAVLTCNDLNPCTLDSCNAVAGCQFTTRADGTSCADSNVCNGAEVCQAGLCQPGTPLNCDDGNPCTADSCSALAGCLHVPISPCP